MASESAKELEIPIYVKGTQKWVTGLTKRTTCDDVIYALLYNDGLHANTAAYAIFEKWREVERPLQGRTKVVKVWRAWGAEQSNVHLTMRRIDELEYSGEFSLTRRKKRSRHKTRDRERERDRDREKGGHAHEHRHHHGYCQSASERLRSMETLVKLVISQERKLKDLIEHGDDTDKLIDKYESRVHSNRLKQNGEDYVQDAYLDGYSDTTHDSMDDLFSKANVEELEMYVEYCDKIIALEGQINAEHSKVEEIAYQIQQCLNDKTTSSGTRTADCEISSVQVELNRAVSCAIMQQYKFQDLQRELQFYEEKLKAREEVFSRLQLELLDLENVDTSGHGSGTSSPSYSSAIRHSHSSDSIKSLNPPPLPERTKRPPSVESSKTPVVFPEQKNNPLPVPERSRHKACNSPNSPISDNHKTVSAISEPLPERKPILKQTCSDAKNGFYEQKETKVRFKTDSLVDRYQWDESSLSEGISIDHSDCSDSKDLFECGGKRDNYSLIKSGVPDRPYLTVKVEDNDSNSDTGLSSMHSDDSAVYHLETLV